MPSIKLLEDNTAILLTATQVMPSPLSAVKELLDNALDARASVISIEISANTVDVVQARDNGHGIPPDGRSICCRQNTTSKLESIVDLRHVGGRSLGFRGQALFAVAQVARKMEITTRVDGENTAVKLDIDENGEVVRRTVASQPVGTTVRIADLFNQVPVRKQTAEKNASKCLASIRKLLQAYALARPTVRLTMRALKSNNSKPNFTYGPNANGPSVQDAALKVIGTEPTSQCSWSVLEFELFEVHALLPRPNANATKISNAGHFVSVDQRPVSTARGLLKQISKRVVEKMRVRNASLAGVKDPFFVINISCPHGSYDPNVEPAKDDIIFDDESKVLEIINKLLSKAYPSSDKIAVDEVTPAMTTPEQNVLIESMTDRPGLSNLLVDELSEVDEEFEALESMHNTPSSGSQNQSHRIPTRTLTDDTMVERCETLVYTNELKVLQNRTNIRCPTMYGCDEDGFEPLRVGEGERPTSADAQLEKDDRTGLNPWTIAKMNAPLKPRVTAPASEHAIQPSPRGRSLSPTPTGRSYPFQPAQIPDQILSDDTHLPEGLRLSNLEKHRGEVDTGSMLQRPLPYTGLPTPLPSSSPHRQCGRQVQQFGLSIQSNGRRDQVINKPFVQPAHRIDPDQNASAMRPQRRSILMHRPRNKNSDIRKAWKESAQPSSISSLVPQDEPLGIIPRDKQIENDFRKRLREAGDNLSSQSTYRVMARHPDSGSRQSHTAASDALESVWTPINASHQLSQSATVGTRPATSSRLRNTEIIRTKSSKLPLERVPDGCETQNIMQSIQLSPARLESLACFFGATVNDLSYDEPVANQDMALPEKHSESSLFSMGLKAVELLRSKLNDAEISNDEDTAFSYMSVLARLEKVNEIDEDV